MWNTPGWKLFMSVVGQQAKDTVISIPTRIKYVWYKHYYLWSVYQRSSIWSRQQALRAAMLGGRRSGRNFRTLPVILTNGKYVKRRPNLDQINTPVLSGNFHNCAWSETTLLTAEPTHFKARLFQCRLVPDIVYFSFSLHRREEATINRASNADVFLCPHSME